MPPSSENQNNAPAENPVTPPPAFSINTMPPQAPQAPQISEPITPAPQKKKWIFIIIIILVVLGLGGVSALAAIGKISIPFISQAPYENNKVLTGVFSNIQKAKNQPTEHYSEFRFYTKKPDSDIKKLSVIPDDPFGGAIDSSMPIAIKVITNGFNKITEDGLDNQTNFSANIDFGGFTFVIDAEFRKVKDEYYLLLKKLPPAFPNGDIIGKWIKINSSDAKGILSETNFPIDLKSQTDEGFMADQIVSFFKIAEEKGFIKVENNPVREKINNIQAYRYDFKIDSSNMADFLDTYFREYARKMKLPEPVETIEESDLKELKEVADYLNNNSNISLWVDKRGVPIKFSLSYRMLLDNKKTNISQFNIDFFTTLIPSRKDAAIIAPPDAILYEEAQYLISGTSKEEALFNKQINSVMKTGGSIESYKMYNKDGLYPRSLEDLKGIPKDVYTNQPFGYTVSSDGKSYKLKYTIVLPEYKKDFPPSGSIASSFYNPKTKRYTWFLKYVNGINTANPKEMSEEAALQEKDTDGDGLADSFETYIGSDRKKRDTDGDGISDADELVKRY